MLKQQTSGVSLPVEVYPAPAVASPKARTERSSPHSFRRWVALGAFVCFAAVGALAWELRPVPPEVKTATVSYEDLSSSVSTTGRVLPVGEFQARASFPGMVEKVYVHVGDTVKAGQLLLKMKDPFAVQRVAAATANLQSTEVSELNVEQNGSQEDRINFGAERKRASAEQAAAGSALDMYKRLQQSGAASGAEVNAATRRLDDANATLQTLTERTSQRYSAPDRASWKARVVDARANLAAQQISYANANITSPVSGTVYLTPVAAYDFVQMGTDLLHVADLSRTEIRASFDEPDMGLLHVGAPVKVTWDGKPNASWVGHVLHPPMAAVQRGNRSVGECTISVEDPRRELLPNTNVVVSVLTQQQPHRLAIPREALHTSGSVNFVYRVENGTLRRTVVDVGIVNLTRVEITKTLRPNDVVALHLNGGGDLAEDLRVKVVQ